jgi:hypothetical protein
LGGRLLYEAEERGCVSCQVQVRTSEQACFDISGLRTTLDQASGFEITEASVERPHGLQCAAGKQFTTGEDGGKRTGNVYGAGKGGEDCASAR